MLELRIWIPAVMSCQTWRTLNSSGRNQQLELDAVFRPGIGRIDTPFSATTFNDLEMGERGSSENPIVLDEEEDKNSSATTPSLSVPLNLLGCSEVVLFEDGLKL